MASSAALGTPKTSSQTRVSAPAITETARLPKT